MYRVITHTMSSGLFGSTNISKQDKEIEKILNEQENLGWEFVSLTQLDTSGSAWVYKLVFRKAGFARDDASELPPHVLPNTTASGGKDMPKPVKKKPPKEKAKVQRDGETLIALCPICQEELEFSTDTYNVGDVVECPYCGVEFALEA